MDSRRTLLCVSLLAAALAAERAAAADELVVIANPAAGAISKGEIVDVYLARSSALTPLDQPESSAIYTHFYKKAIGRDGVQIKALWSRILFTGRGMPPKQLVDSEAIKKAVAANPRAIGYIQKSALDGSVKAVMPVD
jgi:hypothetical protein